MSEKSALRRDIVLIPQNCLPVYASCDGQDWSEVLSPSGLCTFRNWDAVRSISLDVILAESAPAVGSERNTVREWTETEDGNAIWFDPSSWRAARLDEELLGYLVGDARGKHAVLILNTVVIASEACSYGDTAIRFRLNAKQLSSQMGAIKAQALDGNPGLALSDFVVRIAHPNSQHTVWIDDGNQVHLSCIPPGPVRFILSKNGYGDYSREVTIAPGTTTDLGPLELFPAAFLSGQVLDGTGSATPDALVEFWKVTETGHGIREEEYRGGCDEDGRFSFPVEDEIRYLMRAVRGIGPSLRLSQVESLIATKEGRNVVLRLRPIRMVSVPPLSGFVLRQEDGVRIPSSNPDRESGARIHFRLPTGFYSCSWLDENGALRTDSITIDAGTEPVVWEP